MFKLRKLLGGDEFVGRAMRSSAWTVLGQGTSLALRLGGNLILTRLLYPGAFGVMALVTMFMTGLAMFSDVGLGPSIMGSKRGDEPGFLNTAWTIQAVRGGLLALAACAMAWPAAAFYGEPMLMQLLPAAALAQLISGFNPTRIETANRHLMVGRLTIIDLISQTLGLALMIVLAYVTRSVWALVIGSVATALCKLALTSTFLPGERNRFHWEPEAARDLVHFGAWIFLSTAAGFLVTQGDKAVLGRYLTIELLGLYNIGFFLASFPMLLSGAVTGRVMIPLYRERPPGASAENFRKLQRMRFALTGAFLGLLLVMAFFGASLVEVLYDDRYAHAGAIVVLVACVQVPQLIGLTYDQAALAAGESRVFFYLVALKAAVQVAFLLVGVRLFGLVGALAGQGAAIVLLYPATAFLARRYGAWDPRHDLLFGVLGLGLGAAALWLHRAEIALLMAAGS